jgi:hypothetical protein
LNELNDLLRKVNGELERLLKQKEVEEGIQKVVNTELLIGIGAMTRVVGIVYKGVLDEGLSVEMAEHMAFETFKRTFEGVSR